MHQNRIYNRVVGLLVFFGMTDSGMALIFLNVFHVARCVFRLPVLRACLTVCVLVPLNWPGV